MTFLGDLFGDVVSSSDDDDDRPDSDEGSRLYAGFKDYLKDDVDGKVSQDYSFSQAFSQSNSVNLGKDHGFVLLILTSC